MAMTWQTHWRRPTSPSCAPAPQPWGELPAARLPAILVPGEYEGWAQTPNAAFMEREGASVLLPQARLKELPALVDSLLQDGPRMQAMRDALASLSRPNAAADLASMVIEMAGAKAKVVA